ncbi:hypothetical protein IEQ34_020055 [Dendrobium chrysotoxum]|uniref:Uncharacterized protein n=1 Tax=Dendrobium chrysotoxum TaxID=161865 RepID=A0AAV7G127_DENCH|nr:hypothetical protein IEQ34_020055 [Dendrobium chrysotoxum]
MNSKCKNQRKCRECEENGVERGPRRRSDELIAIGRRGGIEHALLRFFLPCGFVKQKKPRKDALAHSACEQLMLGCLCTHMRCRDCTRRFFGSFVAVRLRSFDDFPFLSDRKLRHFDRKQHRSSLAVKLSQLTSATITIDQSYCHYLSDRAANGSSRAEYTGFKYVNIEYDLFKNILYLLLGIKYKNEKFGPSGASNSCRSSYLISSKCSTFEATEIL